MKKIILSALFGLFLNIAHGQSLIYQLSSHILDISTGMLAKDVPVQLEKLYKKRSHGFLKTKNDRSTRKD